MSDSVFIEFRFWALILVSLVLPAVLYVLLDTRHAISQRSILLLGLTLVAIAAADTGLLRSLQSKAMISASLLDDFFNSEMAIGLYVVPAFFGGIGIDLVSGVLRNHLRMVEHRHRRNRQTRL